MAMLTASLADASWFDYTETRDLRLESDGVRELVIDAGAGSLIVTGVAAMDTINVSATIQVDAGNADKARELIASDLTLSLDREGDQVRLKSFFKNKNWFGNADGAVALDIEMPSGLSLRIDDSEGSIVVDDVNADVVIEDGSGSIQVTGVTSLDIDDGSGSIKIDNAMGDVSVVDGSGSISIRKVGGTVRISDGSGSISVRDVEKDLIIEEDGSGGLTVKDVRGHVELDT
jgi:hypothetical protein